jgi:hypothetical protein
MRIKIQNLEDHFRAARLFVPLSVAILFAMTLQATELPLVENGRAKAAIVIEANAGPIAKRAAELLQSRVESKTGARLTIVTAQQAMQLPGSMARIVISEPTGLAAGSWMKSAGFVPPTAGELGAEGFFLRTAEGKLLVVASEGRGLIYGVGKLLHTAKYGDGSMLADVPDGIDRPKIHDRVLLLSTHCDNFYEAQPAPAIVPIIEEAALWGTNGISVFLDESVYNDPFNSQVENAHVRATWDKEKALLRAAQDLGLKPGFVLSANDLYTNQVTSGIVAKGTDKGTDSWNRAPLACPSTKGGRAIILHNKENLFRDMTQAGIRLDNVLVFPYDTGGCFCDRCRPWILTFMKLSEEIAGVLHRYHPSARCYVTDWHCTDNEAEVITDYLNARKPSWLAGVWKDDRHPMDRFSEVDRRYSTLGFLDITMIGGWGTIGANPFPNRLQSMFHDMVQAGISGYMAYSEGIFDDFNKALAERLAWDPSESLASFESEYSNYFFSSVIASDFKQMVSMMEDSWSNPLGNWGMQTFMESGKDAARLNELTRQAGAKLSDSLRNSWRWQVFAERASIGLLATELRVQGGSSAEEVERQIRSAATTEPVLARTVEEKRTQLEQYIKEVVALRSEVYKEPPSRFPPMIPTDTFMIEQVQVPVLAWKTALAKLQ